MKRRLLLALGTLVVLLAGFAAYYVVSRDTLTVRQTFTPGEPQTAGGRAVALREGISVIPGKGLLYMQYDPNHRLQAVYRAETWEKLGDRITLIRPQFEWHLRTGETVYVSAQEGLIRAKEAGERINVRDGQLTGEVEIVLDRNVERDRPPLDERPGDAIRIYVEDLYFDNDLLMLRSEGLVNVFSREADILGRGLRLAWSEGPQELRELRIEQGEYMCIRQGQEQFLQDLSLPGGARPAPTTAPAEEPPGEGAPPTTLLPYGGGGPFARALAPVMLAQLATDTAPAEPAETLPETLPATTPAGPPPPVANTYVAVLSGNVKVTSGQRYLKGADELKLVFEFEDIRRRREQTETRPAAQTATAPATSPAAEESEPPMIVTWTGPLVIKPLRGHEESVPGRFDVSAQGPKIELADGKTQAECVAFEFLSKQQKGHMVGTKDQPVRLSMPEGQRLTAEAVDFDRRAGEVNITGGGTMAMPAGTQAELAELDEGRAADEGGMEIAWSRRVDIRFGVEDAAAPADRPREFLRKAVFVGDVDVRQGSDQRLQAQELTATFRPPAGANDRINQVSDLLAVGGVHLSDKATGDFIKAGRLHVPMAAGPDGRLRPSRAVAGGDVTARQKTTEISSGELVVTFGVQTDEKTGKLRIQPKRLDAKGGVKVTDRGGDEPVVAEAETLTTDLVDRTATLVGTPAKVVQKDNTVEGAKIFLDEPRSNASVIGAGKLRFWTKADISGNETDQPRPVDIAWTEGLDYRGEKRIVVVNGEVRMATAGDTLECQTMRVLLAPREPETETQPAKEGRLSPEDIRPQKIAMVLADKDVRLASVRTDDEGFLELRVQLKSEQVIYEAEVSKVTGLGAGTLVVEDYRAPDQSEPDRKEEIIPTGTVSRPSQSVFQWSKSMEMNQTERVVKLAGDVQMAHRSGRQVVLTEKLKVRPWGDVPEGRKTMMTCGRMLAQFDKPDETADAETQPTDSITGPRVGDLSLFDARQDVNFVDGPRQALCQRIVYEKGKDIAVIYGHLEGQPPKNAVLYFRDEQRGLQRWNSPKIVWYRKTNRVEARDVEAGGGN